MDETNKYSPAHDALEERGLQEAAELRIGGGEVDRQTPGVGGDGGALNACFSASEPLILRTIKAAVRSEERVPREGVAGRDGEVELTPC